MRRSKKPDADVAPPAILGAYRGDFDGRSGWYLRIAYDQLWIERFKRRIARKDRIWLGARGEWWVPVAYEPTLRELLPDFWAHLAQQELAL